MLSILIPVYNYDIRILVHEIHKQVLSCNILFEIIVFDDHGDLFIKENTEINTLSNCTFKRLSKNIGRSAIRNLLARSANYEQLLFLDADVIPKNDNFIKTYLDHLPTKTEIIYGGIEYQKERPDPNQILRWKYGKSREAISTAERKQKPYINLLTLNFLIKKQVFDKIRFNEDIPNLRCEDTLFALEAQKHHISIEHIENPIIHLGLENSKIFLKKSLESIDVRQSFVKNQLMNQEDTKITKLATKIKRWKMIPIFVFLHSITKNYFKKNILSANPSILLFDLYRLGYYFSKTK